MIVDFPLPSPPFRDTSKTDKRPSSATKSMHDLLHYGGEALPRLLMGIRLLGAEAPRRGLVGVVQGGSN